jgi:hypothetical protein
VVPYRKADDVAAVQDRVREVDLARRVQPLEQGGVLLVRALEGGDGDDRLLGSAGIELLDGGTGTDTCLLGETVVKLRVDAIGASAVSDAPPLTAAPMDELR